MKRITGVVVFSLLAGGCAVNEKAMIKRYENVTPSRFEGSVAVVLEERETATVDDQGKGLVYETFRRVKIMDRKAMDCGVDKPNCRLQRYFCYNETWDEVEKIEARTITPDGEVIPVEDDDIQDRTFTTWAIPDQDQRCYVWQAKGVTPGAILEERALIRSKEIMGVGGMWFGSPDPVLEVSYSLDTPADYKYKWKTRHIDIKPTEEKTGNRIVRTWTAREISPFVLEYGMVAPSDVVPQLSIYPDYLSALDKYKFCRSINSWERAGACWNEMVAKKQEATPIIKEVVAEIEKNAKTETEKVKAVWKYMGDNVRYVGLERGLAGLIPLSAHVVCSKKYGDCKAVAGLISVLCREMGLKADPIIIGTRPQLGKVDLEMPSLIGNHSIARVEADGKVYWLDATGRDHSFDTTQARNQGVHVVVANPDKSFLDFVPVQPPEHNSFTKKVVFEPGADSEMRLNVVLTLTGEPAAMFRGMSHEYTEDKWKKYVTEFISRAYPQATDIVQSYKGKEDNEKPFEIEVQARIPRALQPAGKGISFEVKDLFWPKSMIDRFKLPKRRYPLDMILLGREYTRFEIKIPEGMQPAGIPKNVMLEDDFGKVERLVQIEDDKVVAEYTFVIKQLQVPSEKYPEARKFFHKALDASSFVLIFEPEKKKSAGL